MAYCPKCRYEYRGAVDVCPDCGIDLVSDVPPEFPDDIDEMDWVELYTFPGLLYARMAVEMLHLEGIPAYSAASYSSVNNGLNRSDYASDSAIVYTLESEYDTAYDLIEPMIDELPGIFSDEYSMEYEDY